MRNSGAKESRVDEKRKPKPDDPEQSKRFEQTAKELGVDESGKSFQRVFKKLVAPKARPGTRTKVGKGV
jgi:hypothetical protein